MTPEARKALLTKITPTAQDIQSLDKNDAEALYQEAEALAEFKRNNKLLTLYPEHGPLRRELYKKHMQFFRAGVKYNERAVIAANRCLSPWSPIEMGSSTRLVSELIGEEDFYVTSWDGSSRCRKKAGGVILKSIEPMFRLHLDNGQAFDCTCKHRVLTSVGWLPIYQLIQLSSGLHCWRTPEDYQANYDMDGYLYGQQLHHQSGIFQEIPPLINDARNSIQMERETADVGGRISQYIHAFEGRGHPSILDDPNQIGDLCAQFADPALQRAALLTNGLGQALRRYVDEYGPHLSSEREHYHFPYEGRLSEILSKCYDAEESFLANHMKLQGVQLSTQWIPAGRSKIEFLGCEDRRKTYDCFVPFDSPCLVGGQRISIIESIGIQPVLDFTVEETHNYESGGVISHNSGKSFGIGGYETTLHLTGLYPDWWEGRRFHGPIEAWAAGDTSETTRDIIQHIMLGNPGEFGTGLIPKHCLLGQPTHRAGVAGAVDTIRVRHESGGTSWLGLKSFDQGRAKFQGTAKDIIWLDEEPPLDVYTECLTRLLTRNGMILCTFTPLSGLSDVVLMYMPSMAPEPDSLEMEAF